MSNDDPSFASSTSPKPVLIVVMGTSGSGKSTLGSQLGAALSLPFIDGDDLHPSSNVEKMSNGIPLTDADREPWLHKIRRTAVELTKPRSQELARHLVNGEHKEEVMQNFLEVEREETDHVRKLAEVYETSAVEGQEQDQSSDNQDETKFLHPSQHPTPSSSSSSSSSGSTPVRRGCIIACSALKRSYRQLLRGNISSLSSYDASNPHLAERSPPTDLEVYHIYMDISPEVLWSRMQARKKHFMKFEMLKSQLDTLEVPVQDPEQTDKHGATQRGEPGVLVVPVSGEESSEEVTSEAARRIKKLVGMLV